MPVWGQQPSTANYLKQNRFSRKSGGTFTVVASRQVAVYYGPPTNPIERICDAGKRSKQWPNMRFTLIDRIVDLAPGAKITAVKNLSMAEEYLADHFPGFPVMPGVLMLEAMTEAGAWLVRATEDFAHSMVLLKKARNVKFANFLQPGQTLTVTAEIVETTDRETRLKTSGSVEGTTNVSAQLVARAIQFGPTKTRMAISLIK